MLFDISNLPQAGADLDTPVTPPSFAWEGGSTVRCGGFRLRARFRPTRHGWELTGSFSGAVELECTRCLGPVEQALDAPFRLLVVPAPREGDAREGTEGPTFEPLAEDDPMAVDIYPLPGQTLDLAAVIQEQIDLALPLRILCRDDCLGLCNRCGADLNRGRCDCPAIVDERWGGLIGLKAKLQSNAQPNLRSTKRDRHDPGRK